MTIREKISSRKRFYILSNIYTLIGLVIAGMNQLFSIWFFVGILIAIIAIGFGEFIWRCPKCNDRLPYKDYNPKSCSKCKISFNN